MSSYRLLLCRPSLLCILVVSLLCCLCLNLKATAEDLSEETAASTKLVHIHLSGLLTETPVVDELGLSGEQMVAQKDLIALLEKARDDESVDGLILTIDQFQAGLAQTQELLKVLASFNDPLHPESGKPVYVHADSLTMPTYALFSGTTHLSVVPTGDVWLMGFYSEGLYLKGLLDKIGVQADIIHVGDFKSAGETFTRTEPSKAAQENIDWLLDDIYEQYLDVMVDSVIRRNTKAQLSSLLPSKEKFAELMDLGPFTAEQAAAGIDVDLGPGASFGPLKLVDSVLYRNEFLDRVRADFDGEVEIDNRYGADQVQAIDLNNPFAFFSILSQVMAPPAASDKPAIAIVYVEGPILPGYAQPSIFGSTGGAYSGDLAHALRKAAEDPTVKAVVLRVDSPGGSALASEIILNAGRQLQLKKPLIVSMGNVAASGGYYVSCRADAIFAEEATITGSIGVVGGKFVTTGLWDKLGVNWVPQKRGANADLFNSSRPFDPAQREKVSSWMETIYTQFKSHVTAGRKDKLTGPIDGLAGGRVYSGLHAQKLGLVDRIGGLSEAIRYAAGRVELEDYDIRVIPEPVDLFTEMMEDLMGMPGSDEPTDVRVGLSAKQRGFAATFGGADSPLNPQMIRTLARIEPQRARLLLQALARLELLHGENALLMLPGEWLIH